MVAAAGVPALHDALTDAGALAEEHARWLAVIFKLVDKVLLVPVQEQMRIKYVDYLLLLQHLQQKWVMMPVQRQDVHSVTQGVGA